MMRTNLILLAVLIILSAAWFLTRESDSDATSGPAPRLFPEFNKEAADLIVLKDGWKDRTYVFGRLGSAWKLVSAGDYPVKGETADRMLDAVWNLRKQNLVGTSAELRKETRTGDEGRLVQILKGGTGGEVMAEFRIGKNPKGDYDSVFIRRDDGDAIHRTRTILTADQAKSSDKPWDATDAPARAFGWDSYVQGLSQWVDTTVWNLGDAEEAELWLERPGDEFKVKLVKKGQDDWELIEEGKDPVPADVDAVRGITSSIRYLNFEEVVGLYENVREVHGLTEPAITLVMTLRKKVEKKPEEAEEPADGGDEKPADGEGEGEKDEEKEPAEEYVTFKRYVEVGNKVEIAKWYDDENGVEKKEFYAIRVSGDFDSPEDEKKAAYVYLVSDYTIGGLKKTLDELKAESEESEDAATPDEPETPTEPGEDGTTEPSDGEPSDGSGDTKGTEEPEQPGDDGAEKAAEQAAEQGAEQAAEQGAEQAAEQPGDEPEKPEEKKDG